MISEFPSVSRAKLPLRRRIPSEALGGQRRHVHDAAVRGAGGESFNYLGRGCGSKKRNPFLGPWMETKTNTCVTPALKF